MTSKAEAVEEVGNLCGGMGNWLEFKSESLQFWVVLVDFVATGRDRHTLR
jgi:hypothetical protein